MEGERPRRVTALGAERDLTRRAEGEWIEPGKSHIRDFCKRLYVNRVAYRREAFVLRRGRVELAELRPVPSGRRLGDLPGMLASLPSLSESDAKRFAADVRAARTSLRREGLRDPWAS
jgi:hypothetical protein